MTKEGYLKIKNFLLSNKPLLYLAAALCRFGELAVYLSYPLFLIILIINKNLYCIRSVLVCGIGFLLLSFFRKRINAERPYEKFGFTPLIKKETKGCSFPSRHTFSAAIIGMSLLAVYPIWGGIVLGLAVALAALRVVLGVHFIKDTAAGLLIGVIFGLFSFI